MSEETFDLKDNEKEYSEEYFRQKIEDEVLILRKAEEELQFSYNKWKENVNVFSNHFGKFHSSMNKAVYVNGDVYKELVWTEEWLDKVREQSYDKEKFINKYFDIMKNEIAQNQTQMKRTRKI